MSAFSNTSVPDKSANHVFDAVQQNVSEITINPETPLDDTQYLLQNAQCFQYIHENQSTKQHPKKKNNNCLQITTQFLYGSYMPPYYSVLDFPLMKQYVTYLKNKNEPMNQLLLKYKEIIEHEKDIFNEWLSTLWEKKIKNRRLNVIPLVEDYVKSACDYTNDYIKSHFSGPYTSFQIIDFYREDICRINKVEMKHCQRVKSSDENNRIEFPKINITDLESKISFTDGIYSPPQKSSFMEDELCQILSKEHCSDVNICLSSLKYLMNLEKPNSLWIIPVYIDIDTDKRKTINIGGALSTGCFSQEGKIHYYLRKEIKKKFIQCLSNTADNESIEESCKYNYDKWTIKESDNDNKLFNLLVRSKPHTKEFIKKKGNKSPERVLIPKVEYQPEFGFEKICEDQLIEYWLDTYFRNPDCSYALVSVQYNLDIMMFKSKTDFFEMNNSLSDDKKQTYLRRLYTTLEKLSQLDKGEYIMLHNPKKQYQVEICMSSKFGGFNLLNTYILHQAGVSEYLTCWNPIDAEVLCPIHEHFKVAPCLFRANPNSLNSKNIEEQIVKVKTAVENHEKREQEQVAKKKKKKREKNKLKREINKDNDNLLEMKRTAFNM